MHGSVVRLIAGKETRDLLRDRRTVLLIIILPMILYPLFGLSGFLLATSLLSQPAVIGVSGAENLPGGIDMLSKVPTELISPEDNPFPEAREAANTPMKLVSISEDPESLLQDRKVDAVLVVPNTLAKDLDDLAKKPKLKIMGRDGDEKSKLAQKRLGTILRNWESELKAKRFQKAGLAKDFDRVFTIEDPQTDKPKAKKAADDLRDTFVRVFPFILMMWLVAGSIQPAVDMTAGEKERGTMETLLISPAERGEIVVGKFLATTFFTFGSVIWNVIWLAAAAIAMELILGFPIVNKMGLLGCVVVGLPLAMFFSGVSLALGVFARSTKEGQYYLMPLILITMPLAFSAMLPGQELKLQNFWIPVTGAMLLQSSLLSISATPLQWELIPAVLGALAFWVALALSFAIWQFRRESVLFRETGQSPKKKGLGHWFKLGS